MRHKARHKGPVITMNWNTTLDVKTRVAVGAGARQKLSSILAQLGAGKRVLIVCQPSTAVHWLRDILDTLPGEDFQVTTLEVPDGEQCKTTEWLLRIWEHLEGRGFDRQDTIVALGGGAVLDLAGFACSTYLRGLNLVLIPTSLLAQVDASIGGKNAINLPTGKNLAGTFFFPRAVLADQEVLSTLPEKQITSGLAEIIKYAMIEETVAKATDYEKGPKPLFELIEEMVKESVEWDDPTLAGLITNCIKMKLYVVHRDPHETGVRRCLNLGHTLGHAIEAQSEFELSHGEAVAIGLHHITKYSVSQKKLDKDALERVKEILMRAELPTDLPKGLTKERLVAQMNSDKKRSGDKVKLVVPQTKLGVVDFESSYPVTELAKLV
ncbi:MAG: 3-dehydroquinate synthase [Candidatus Melainabacteria bacterium]|uniref:3-dehydroquinate synthase n=1 Tax=Candidatus Obscuribacter phosphatis TaxID=1906157 RepID=A0A8J7TMJ5_9BACT|nr:3-dehydroquinate synthase [Candidatus Obscuribacter phosphatis]MCA0314269.1 3-dehydroquinate synthase [Candidatus Melainabacteria bacterium]